MTSSPTPHNDFFYQVMSRKNNADAFFKRYLPKKVIAMVNLDTLLLAESKHLSDYGKSLYNDVLYRCEFHTGQPGYLFAMCEHQSTPEHQMPLRLLEYNVNTIRKHLKQGKGKFPVILNVVLYHGKKNWNYSTNFIDYYANPELGKKFLYMAPFTLVNIPTLTTHAISQDKALGFCLEAFRCTSQRDPYSAFKKTVQLSRQFSENFYALPKEERNLVGAYLGNYIDRGKYNLEDLANLLSRNEQEKEEIMTSIAHTLKQEGEIIGIRKGKQEGAHNKALHIAKNMLSKLHLGIKAVKEVTGLSEEELMKLQEEGQAK